MRETDTVEYGTLWSPAEAAKAFRTTKGKVERAMKLGDLPIKRIGNTVMLVPRDVRDWYDAQ